MWGEGTDGCEVTCEYLVCGTVIVRREREREREMWEEGTGGCEVTCGCLVCGTVIGGGERDLGRRDWWI
jgi:hypothetical protein